MKKKNTEVYYIKYDKIWIVQKVLQMFSIRNINIEMVLFLIFLLRVDITKEYMYLKNN